MSTTYVNNPHNFTFFFESNLNSSSFTGCFHFSNERHAYILDYFFAPLVSRKPLLSSMKTLFLVKVRNSGGKKVREVARRLSVSEADLYRKQKIALESVAQVIADMEVDGAGAPSGQTSETKPSNTKLEE